MISRLAAILALLGFTLGMPASARAQVPAKISADAAVMVKGNSAFAMELYARLAAREGNLFFSPYSISSALAMTHAGARGETARQMASVLHLDLAAEQLHPAWADLIRAINGPGSKRGYQLSTANALWGQKNYGFLPPFLKLTSDHYGAGLRELDFQANLEQSRKTINAWVEKQTQDRIKDLIPKGVMDPSTRLVLTNAIYFKAGWHAPFRDKAREGPFHLKSGKKVAVPLMHHFDHLRYLKTADFQMVEMPYENRDLSMVVFLPARVDGLADFEKNLTPARLDQWRAGSKDHLVNVTVPRFKITAEFKLKEVLSAMGMPLPFSLQADFSGMTSREKLLIDQVLHKAFVEVNEKGTEAAAATAVLMVPTGARILPEATFRADHPFVFVIRENRTGSILFMGRVADPR